MTRKLLLEKICPAGCTNACVSLDCNRHCYEILNKFLDEYDKQIRADVIDEFVKKICEKYTEEERKGNYKQYCGEIKQNIADIAEQLKVKEQNK